MKKAGDKRISIAKVCCVLVLAGFTSRCAPILKSELPCEGIEIISKEIAVTDARQYCRYAVGERKKVEEFWGTTWQEPIRIHISSSYRITRSLVPGHFGNRGFMEMPLRRVRDNSGALLHEIVHIYAPNGNRFLAEGLAVYLHARLAGNPAFPNFGENLRSAAVRVLPQLKSLQALNGVRTPRPLSTVMPEETAYILAGSFVGFLIEEYGLAPFRNLYDSGDYEKPYSKSLAMLENEWRASLQTR
jgi:hypothetical protein